MAAELLACDWGTTNLRAWTLNGAGEVVAQADFDLGVSQLGPGEAARRFADTVRPQLEAHDLPAIICGMAGSDRGWISAPYLEIPADLAKLAKALLAAPGDGPLARIVPGLRCRRPDGEPDVMRGEETQIAGWLSQDPARREGRRLICHPGTHTKWVIVQDGRIERFITAMSGELFALLTRHSLMRTTGDPDDPAAFDEGLAAAGEGEALAVRLFAGRSRVVTGERSPTTTAAFLSGVLIGADVAASPAVLGWPQPERVELMGDERLCSWYQRAMETRGIAVEFHSGEDAAVAGLMSLHRMAAG
jgi:2-dehydro-3-deoxygalactonokinase